MYEENEPDFSDRRRMVERTKKQKRDKKNARKQERRKANKRKRGWLDEAA